MKMQKLKITGSKQLSWNVCGWRHIQQKVLKSNKPTENFQFSFTLFSHLSSIKYFPKCWLHRIDDHRNQCMRPMLIHSSLKSVDHLTFQVNSKLGKCSSEAKWPMGRETDKKNCARIKIDKFPVYAEIEWASQMLMNVCIRYKINILAEKPFGFLVFRFDA